MDDDGRIGVVKEVENSEDIDAHGVCPPQSQHGMSWNQFDEPKHQR